MADRVPGYPELLAGSPVFDPDGPTLAAHIQGIHGKIGNRRPTTLTEDTTAVVGDLGKVIDLAGFSLNLSFSADLENGWFCWTRGPGSVVAPSGNDLDGASELPVGAGSAVQIVADGTGSFRAIQSGGAVAAVSVGVTPAGDIGANNVQAALEELDEEKAAVTDVRERLTSSRTYYVRPDGSDSNDGLADTSGGAFLTLQKAWDTICSLDLVTFAATIQVADDGGTPYTGGIDFNKAPVGGSSITITGNTGTPADCEISSNVGNGKGTFFVSAAQLLPITIQGFRLTDPGTGASLVRADAPCKINLGANVYGPAGGAQIRASTPGIYIVIAASYTIDGGGTHHWLAGASGAYIRCTGFTLTISGTPAFSSAFAVATLTGAILAVSNTYSGSATGKRYDATFLGVIQINGATLPGNSAGTTANGGVAA